MVAGVALLFSISSIGSGQAAGLDTNRVERGPVLLLTEENDFVNGTDRWYTQGARIAFLQAENHVPRWAGRFLQSVPSFGFTSAASRIGYDIGQSIYTPDDTHHHGVVADDRPYAGWLYGGLILQRRGVGLGGYQTLENLQLELGVVGPESFAEHVQTWYHDEAPQGWDHQLDNEPGLALRFGRSWLIPLPAGDRRYVDLIPHGGLSAGNVDTSFRAGTTVRAGWNLPDDFGPQPIESVLGPHGRGGSDRTRAPWSFYFFSGVEGRAVLYTVFLDGNIFEDSHDVDKRPFVGEWRSGAALRIRRVELAYTHIIRTREFYGQSEEHVYGSFSLHVTF